MHINKLITSMDISSMNVYKRHKTEVDKVIETIEKIAVKKQLF